MYFCIAKKINTLNNKPKSKLAKFLKVSFFVLLAVSVVLAVLALCNMKLYGAYSNYVLVSSCVIIGVAFYLNSFYRHIDGETQKLAKLIAFPCFFLFAVSVYPFLLKALWLTFGFFSKDATIHSKVNNDLSIDFYNSSDSSYKYTNIRVWERKYMAFEKLKHDKVLFDKLNKDDNKKISKVEVAEYKEGDKLKLNIYYNKNNNDTTPMSYEMDLNKRNVWFLR